MTPYYEHGGVTIYHGDCREVLPSLPSDSVDLVISDPIYGISQPGVIHEGQPGAGSRNFDFFDNDSADEAKALALAATRESFRLLRAHGSIYIWCGHRQFGALTDYLEANGWRTRFLVWQKLCPPPPPPGSGWPSAAELCVYGFRPGRRWMHDGKDFPKTNVILADSYRFGKPGKVDHPTQKPPETVKPLIIASSREGDVILDFCMGSGTTLRAAKDLGREAIGIEIEEKYCEIAARRLSQEVLSFGDAPFTTVHPDSVERVGEGEG